MFSGTAVLLGLGILEISQPIKDAFGALGAGLGHIKDFIMMRSGPARTAIQDTGASTPRVMYPLRRATAHWDLTHI